MNYQQADDELKRLEARVALALSRAAGAIVATRADLIFRPGVTSAGNAVETWPEVKAAILAANGFITVAVDGSKAPPEVPGSSGVTDCQGATTFVAYNQVAGAPAYDTLTIKDGATLRRPKAFADGLNVKCECLTTPALSFNTAAGGAQDAFQLLRFINLILLAGATVSPINVAAAGTLYLVTERSVNLDSSLAGTVPIISLGLGASLVWDCYTGGACLGTDTISGGGAGAAITFQHDDLSVLPTFAAFGFIGTVTENRVSLAAWALPSSGNTGAEPTPPNVQTGQMFFNTAIFGPLWRDTSGAWVASGTVPMTGDPSGAASSVNAWIAATASASALGLSEFVPPGIYKIAAPLTVPSNLLVTFGPQVTFNSTIAYVDGFADCLFTTAPAGASLTTLGAAVIEGSNVVQVAATASLVLGNLIEIVEGAAASALSYKVAGLGVIGTTDVTAGGLYGGGGTLNGQTLILNVNGAGLVALNLNGGTNTATRAAFLAALTATWPALQVVLVGGPSGGYVNGTGLVLTAQSVVVGAGTANAHLGLTAPSPAMQTDIAVGFPFSSGDSVSDAHLAIRDTTLDFSGATLAGTGGRTTHTYDAWNTIIKNVTVNSSWTVTTLDHDLGSRYSSIRDATVNYVANETYAFAIEDGQLTGFERCNAVGAHPIGFLLTGVSSYANDCMSDGSTYGMQLASIVPADLWCARYCTVKGGQFNRAMGGGTGIAVFDNSQHNTISGVTCNYNRFGFQIQTRAVVAFHGGASFNTLVGCVAYGNSGVGVVVGDGANALTGTAVSACAIDSNAIGVQVQALADRTTIGDCRLSGNGTGMVISGTRTQIDSCSTTLSTNNALLLLADTIIRNYTSFADSVAGQAVYADGGNLNLDGFSIENTSAGAFIGVYIDSAGENRITGGRILSSGAGAAAGTGINMSGAGTLYLSDVTITGMATGLTAGTGTVKIGPGCSLDGCTTPVNFGASVVTMAQTGGVASFPGGATTTKMTFAQHYCQSIEVGTTTPIAAGAQTINPLGSFLGQQFVVVNNNTAASTTTVFGVIIPVASRYLLRCNAAGVWEHDTLT